MKLNDMKFKSLLFGGLALALAACSSEEIQNPGNVDVNPTPTPESTLKTANVLVGQWGQNRVINVDTWGIPTTRSLSDWEEKLDFTVPSINDMEDISASNFDNTKTVYYVPENFNNALSLGWKSLPEGSTLYILGEVSSIADINYPNNLTIYILGTLKNFAPTTGDNMVIVNVGDLELKDYSKVKNVYNNGDLTLSSGNQYYTPENVDIPNDFNLFSKGGIITFDKKTDLKGHYDIHNKVYVNGDLQVQNTNDAYLCELEIEGDLRVNGEFSVSSLKAKNIEFTGFPVNIAKEGHIIATGTITMDPSGAKFIGPKDSWALIESQNFVFNNSNMFDTAFSENIYFKVNGFVENKYNGPWTLSINEYLEQKAGDNLKERFNSEISGVPECGEPYGNGGGKPEEGPTLEIITSMEAPGHDHNEDKTEGMRHLSATSIDYRDGIVYVSYHMRGANWGTGVEDYDHDDTEGCIETWQFVKNDLNQTVIELGKYMWTYDFDFNHIVLDGSDIIAMGHQNKMGGIIGKLNNEFHDFNPSLDGGLTSSTEFKYQLLKTDEGVYDDFVNESGNSSNQLVDYKSVGDVNCLVKIGDNYFFTASGGYGKINSDLDQYTRLTRGTDFIVTDGSAKHIIKKNDNEVALIYLDTRPESTATAESSATLATVASSTFPIGASTTPLSSVISPVDGKNVLAWNGSDMFACMGRGGLNVDNTIYNFGEDGKEPVNGIDMDDKYIYLAVGSHLRVLDINNPNNQIVSYHLPDMSANFVKVVNYDGEKYIIVAYGQAGVRVFRLKNA